MLDELKQIFLHSYQPLNLIEISEKNLKHNYKYLASINKKIKIAPVLKSNAYGHGLVLVARILEELNPPFFCVDSLYEAYELTKNGISTPILIMGFIDPVSLKTKHLPFSFAVYSHEQVEALKKYQPHARVHIFVDTGMHREGILLDELSQFVNFINTQTNLQIEGLMSHFGESENPKNPLTKQQINNFEKAQKIVKAKWVHISNSGGVLNNFGIGNMGRAGISLFGIGDDNLKPTLTLKTHIAQVKTIKKGEAVGYSFTFTPKKDLKIATLPIGYYDGLDRRLSNKGFVKIGDTECKIIGRISMNITTIDVSDVKNVKVGDEVIVFSNIQTDNNSIENTARLCKTIPYEILVGLASSTRRAIGSE